MICQGDNVSISTESGSAHGFVTSRRRGLVGIYIAPGSAGFGCYKDWTGIEFFLPGQIEVSEDFSGRPRGRLLAGKEK